MRRQSGPKQPCCSEMCSSHPSGQRPWRGLQSCLEWEMERKWRNIKNKKQICLCTSRLPGIKGCPLTTQWHGDCSHSSKPRLLGWVCATPAFWPGIPWKNEFPPQCTTMLWEARARVRACCDVNLMTSCCSDGRSKQLNKGIVVFSPLCRRGAPPPVLLLSSRAPNSEASVSTVAHNSALEDSVSPFRPSKMFLFETLLYEHSKDFKKIKMQKLRDHRGHTPHPAPDSVPTDPIIVSTQKTNMSTCKQC